MNTYLRKVYTVSMYTICTFSAVFLWPLASGVGYNIRRRSIVGCHYFVRVCCGGSRWFTPRSLGYLDHNSGPWQVDNSGTFMRTHAIYPDITYVKNCTYGVMPKSLQDPQTLLRSCVVGMVNVPARRSFLPVGNWESVRQVVNCNLHVLGFVHPYILLKYSSVWL